MRNAQQGTWEWGGGIRKIWTTNPMPDPLKHCGGLGLHTSSAGSVDGGMWLGLHSGCVQCTVAGVDPVAGPGACTALTIFSLAPELRPSGVE